MGDVNIGLTIDETNAIRGLDKVITAMEDVGDRSADVQKNIDGAFGEGAKAVMELEDAAKGATTQIQSVESATKKADTTSKGFRRTLRDVVGDYQIMGVSLNGVVENLGKKRTALTNLVGSLTRTNRLLAAFRVALAATGIGALVIGIGALFAALTRTQGGIDAVNRAFSGLSATFDVIVDRASRMGNAILSLVRGDSSLAEAANEIGASFRGIGAEIREDASAAAELERASQNLRDNQRALNVEYAETQARIERLRNLSRDETQSTAERQRSLQEAIRLQTELEQKQIDLAQENLRITRERNSLGESLAADLDAEADAEIRLANIKGESDRRRREDLSQIQTLRRMTNAEALAAAQEEERRVQQLTDDYNRLIEALNNQAQAASLENLSGSDRLFAERDLAVQQIETLAQEIRDKAAEAGATLPDSFDQNIEELFTRVNTQLREGLTALNAEQFGVVEIEDGFDVLRRNLPNNLEETGIEAREALKRAFAPDEIRPLFQRIRDDILIALNISNEDAEVLLGGLQTVFQNFQNGLSANLEAEIAAQETILNGINQRIDETERALDRELQLKTSGLANNFSVEQANLEELQKARDDAEKKRQEAEAKAARIRQIQEAAAQSANLLTTASNLTKGFTAINPIIGLVLAAAAITTLFSIFANARKKATEATKLFKGGKIPGHLSDDRTNPGLAIEGTNIRVGGGEMVVNRRDTREHDAFLEELNRGQFRGVDLSQAVNTYQALNRTGYRIMADSNEVLDKGRILEVRITAGREKEIQILKQGFAVMERKLAGVQMELANRPFLDDNYKYTQAGRSIIRQKRKKGAK